MFKALLRSWVPAILIFITAGMVHAQESGPATPELKIRATDHFENGRYDAAYKDFVALLDRYPKDGLFSYYAGISLLKQHKDLSGAIEYLELACSKSTVPPDVYYYLGMAYRLDYRFPESEKAFSTFARAADRSQNREFHPGREASMSANAMEQTLEYNPFKIYKSSLFTFSDSGYVKQIRNKGGQLSTKPEGLYTRNDEQGGITGFCFKPKSLGKGDYIYYAGMTKKQGSDLYRVKKTLRKGWGDPEPLESLNTDFDEIMPYYDPVSNDLYFASKGHNSMGGFDVFKSHYDQDRDNWSQPVSLGFPVNSPENEYLVMPGPDLGTLLLITDRQGLDSMLTLYILQMQEPKKSLAEATPAEIRRIGNLGGIGAIHSIVDMREEPVLNQPAAEKERSAETGITGHKNPHEMPDRYQENLKLALRYQVTSDSLTKLAREARIRVREMDDANERWAWQRKIIAWEKEAGDFQEKADKLYALVREKEHSRDVQTADVPSSIRKDTVINDMTVYHYTVNEKENRDTKTSIAETAKEAFSAPEEPGRVVTPPVKKKDPGERFVILAHSPYNKDNPFPMDTKIPAGPFYKIQLGVYSSKIDYTTFGGISPITAETIPGKSLIRYYAGKFSRYEDVRQALEKVRQAGYNDAFIVAWYNTQKMPASRVLELEKRDSPR